MIKRTTNPRVNVRGIRALAAVAALALVLTACASPSGTPGGAATPANNGVKGPPKGGNFTWAFQTDAKTIDPALAADLPSSYVVNVYDALVRFEGTPNVLVMHLAESITPSADAKTYTAKLRKGITFHDGSPLNAAAVAYSFDRLIGMAGPRAAQFLGVLEVGGTTVVDDLTVKFSLKSPSGIFPQTLGYSFIVNPAVIKANTKTGTYGTNGDYGTAYLQSKDAGSGPYTITSRTLNSEVLFKAFPAYFQGWKTNQFETFKVQISGEPATAGLILQQGVVDGISENYPDNVFNDLEKVASVKVNTDIGSKPFYIFLNNQKAPTDNKLFRQALAWAFDYESALKIMPGAVLLTGPLTAGMLGARDKPAYTFNTEKAKELLKQSGVDPKTVTLEWSAPGGPASVQTRLGLLFQDNLSKLGITVKIVTNTWAGVLTQSASAKTTMSAYPIQLAPAFPDPEAILTQSWSTSSHGSWSGLQYYKNPEIDKMLIEGKTTVDTAKRKVIYEKIQTTIIEDSPAIFMLNMPIRVALNAKVGGYKFVTQYYNYDVYKLFSLK